MTFSLPIGGVAIVILIIFLNLPVEKQNFKEKLLRIDYMGNFLVLAAATLFLLALNFGGQTFPWKSAPVIASCKVPLLCRNSNILI